MKYFILILLLFILLILSLLTYKKNLSLNYFRHLDNKNSIGHFSRIDRYNYFLYPSLFFTHPMYFNLKKGDSLYIPPKWWHWVKNKGHNIAVNFWGKDNQELYYGNKPFKDKHNQNLTLESLNDEIVSVWDSNNYQINIYDQKLDDFLKNKIKGQYVITLKNILAV